MNKTYAKVDKERVKRICANYDTHRNQIIKIAQDEAIAEVMNGKWFAPKTREYAIKRLDEGFISRWWVICNYGRDTNSVMTRVAKLAAVTTDDYLYMDADTAWIVFGREMS